MDQLEEKEKMVKDIHVDCEQYGAQHGDIQRYIKELLLGLTSNIQVIRENQNIIRIYLDKLREAPKEIIPAEVPKQETPVSTVDEKFIEETVKPETHAMSTQTFMAQPTDNIMVIQSMNADGETIQIYNVPCSHEEGKEEDRNVIVEAKYIRSHSGEPKRASELVLKNVPAHFETTFVEPDETTTEIIVDPDGSKRIIVRKLTKTTQQIVSREEYEDGALPEHVRSQLGLSGTTHDVIVGTPDNSFEQHRGITESSIHAVIEHVTHRVIKKTRKIIKKIVIIDGQEHITEEVIEEPDEIQEFSEDRPAIEYDVSEAVLVDQPAEETVLIEEVISREVAPQPVKPEPEVTSVHLVIETVKEEVKPDDVKEVEPVVEQPVAVCEGENQPEQVFEIITEAPVDLIASEVEKLAPIEDITNIWPYATPHIATQSTIAEITEQPAPSQQDLDSQSIWPQNLTIGSNIDFNEYSFDRTLEKSSDFLDNDSFVTTDPGLEDVQKIIDVRLTEKEVKQPEPTKQTEIIELKPVDENTIEVKPEEIKPEPKVESEPDSFTETVGEVEPELEAISGSQTVTVTPVQSPPTSPKSPTPQMGKFSLEVLPATSN